jgi:hypothetical protein
VIAVGRYIVARISIGWRFQYVRERHSHSGAE